MLTRASSLTFFLSVVENDVVWDVIPVFDLNDSDIRKLIPKVGQSDSRKAPEKVFVNRLLKISPFPGGGGYRLICSEY